MVSAKALEVAIALWEMDVQLYTDALRDEFAEANRRTFLERMCPEKFQDHLHAQGLRFATCDDVRLEISDWLARENARSKAGVKAIGAVGAPEAEAAEEEWEEAYLYDTASDQWICGLAPKRRRTGEASDGDTEMPAAASPASLRRSKAARATKEARAAKEAAPKGRCWLCGGPHFQVDCPLRADSYPVDSCVGSLEAACLPRPKPTDLELVVSERRKGRKGRQRRKHWKGRQGQGRLAR